MQCFCGFSTDGKWVYARHWRACDTFWQHIYDELRRISQKHCDNGAVSQAAYNKHRRPEYPPSSGLVIARSWGEIHDTAKLPLHTNDSRRPRAGRPERKKNGNPEQVQRGRPVKYVSFAHWDKLLPPGKHIAPDVPVENLYNVIIEMVRVAHHEAKGMVSHHVNIRSEEKQRAIQLDAQRFIQEWQDGFMQQL